MATRSLLLVAGAATLVSGCASRGDFPSLTPRAVEREFSSAPVPPCAGAPVQADPPALPVPVADDPQLRARVEALVAQARAGEQEFAALLPSARRSVARAGGAGSEAWIEAQQLLSRLEAARSPAVDALADLDALAIARAGDDDTSFADRERVLAAAREVRAMADAQRAELERLSGRLSRP